ncbi:MAG: hypothetical protein WCP10_01695 [Desulfuromonadales bacterium]
MSQISISSLAIGLLALLSLATLPGCGDKNSQAVFEPSSGKHVAEWLPNGHTAAAKEYPESCTECHGAELNGGISKVACTQCHLGSAEAPHPVFWNYTSTKPTAWGKYAYAFHGIFAKQKGTTSCAVASCHGSDLLGVSKSGPSCKNCHKDIMSAHPVEWVYKLVHSPGGVATVLPDHGAWISKVESASCKNVVCHGPQGEGVFLSGLKCTSCHNKGF